MFRPLLKWTGILLLGASLCLVGIYGYLASFEGKPAERHAFFQYFIPGKPLVIAHRGGAGLFPENTLYAFQEAWKMGVDILEMDVRETADGALVLLHDKTVDRTTDGSGEVSQKTLAEVKQLNAAFRFTTDGGQSFPLREQKISIPTLEEVFSNLPQARYIVEIKHETPTIAKSLCFLIRKHNLQDKVITASFSQNVLDSFRSECAEVATSASTSEVTKFMIYYKTGLGKSYSPPMFALQTPEKIGSLQIVSKDFLETAHHLNLQVHVWTINRNEDMQRLIETGVDGIMTDYPDRLLKLVKK
jgi:glycerophosphoryl diester phosphodiesterase